MPVSQPGESGVKGQHGKARVSALVPSALQGQWWQHGTVQVRSHTGRRRRRHVIYPRLPGDSSVGTRAHTLSPGLQSKHNGVGVGTEPTHSLDRGSLHSSLRLRRTPQGEGALRESKSPHPPNTPSGPRSSGLPSQPLVLSSDSGGVREQWSATETAGRTSRRSRPLPPQSRKAWNGELNSLPVTSRASPAKAG